jgi:glucosylceramidase
VSWGGYENQLAFLNPEGSVVVVIQNDMAEPMPVRIGVGDTRLTPTLPTDSFSTLVIRRRREGRSMTKPNE